MHPSAPGSSLSQPAGPGSLGPSQPAGPLPGGSTGTATVVSLIPVLEDNYVFVLHTASPGAPAGALEGPLGATAAGQAVLVDPAVAAPVVAWLEQRQLEPIAVLHTHHHHDHIGGTPELLRRWPQLAVIAAAADRQRIPFQSQGVGDGDQLSLLGRRVEVLAVPGHTRAHIAFYLPPVGGPPRAPQAVAPEPGQAGNLDRGSLEPEPPGLGSVEQEPVGREPDAGPTDLASPGELFCGDTLFAGGCGRLLEGSPQQLWQSLKRLGALPAATRVWCSHEYTEANLRWAHHLHPDDPAINQRFQQVLGERALDHPTIPSSIGEEWRTNLFLRSQDAEAFARYRHHKDHWRG